MICQLITGHSHAVLSEKVSELPDVSDIPHLPRDFYEYLTS
jgi:hypothetical protein